MITPVQEFDGWWAKRDDLDENHAPDFPSGVKARNFIRLCSLKPGTPIVVGCAASSTAQIVAAAVGRMLGVGVEVFVAGRANPTPATEYAARTGAKIIQVSPGYLTVCQARAKERAAELRAVTWETSGVVRGSMEQVGNLPDTSHVVVPTGAGASCAGVLAGLARVGYCGTVVAVCMSPMATREGIEEMARVETNEVLPALEVVRAAGGYEDWAVARLPNGDVLDPFYAAKALSYVVDGGCLWVPGCRPITAMPARCRIAV
jgi:1-aminocyclopropane-1-carboxylate deaminase/D-cysteine desulfhydrase-like pyridoxal-dependent ACC family enzyme